MLASLFRFQMEVQASRLGGRLYPSLSILSKTPISVRNLRNFLLDAFLSLRQIAESECRGLTKTAGSRVASLSCFGYFKNVELTMETHRVRLDRKTFLRTATAVLSTLMLFNCGQALASILPLPPEQDSWSDIFGTVRGSYTAATDSLVINGGSFASAFDVGAGTGFDYSGFVAPITLANLKVNGSGVVTTPGDFKIRLASPSGGIGPYPAGASPIGDLLTGQVTDVLFSAVGVLQMQFTVTGGSAAGDFGGVGALGGLIVSMVNSGASGATANGFASDFSMNAGASASTVDVLGNVPEPTSILVFGALGMAAIAAVRSSRQMLS
jgi:hypothetical protein